MPLLRTFVSDFFSSFCSFVLGMCFIVFAYATHRNSQLAPCSRVKLYKWTAIWKALATAWKQIINNNRIRSFACRPDQEYQGTRKRQQNARNETLWWKTAAAAMKEATQKNKENFPFSVACAGWRGFVGSQQRSVLYACDNFISFDPIPQPAVSQKIYFSCFPFIFSTDFGRWQPRQPSVVPMRTLACVNRLSFALITIRYPQLTSHSRFFNHEHAIAYFTKCSKLKSNNQCNDSIDSLSLPSACWERWIIRFVQCIGMNGCRLFAFSFAQRTRVWRARGNQRHSKLPKNYYYSSSINEINHFAQTLASPLNMNSEQFIGILFLILIYRFPV